MRTGSRASKLALVKAALTQAAIGAALREPAAGVAQIMEIATFGDPIGDRRGAVARAAGDQSARAFGFGLGQTVRAAGGDRLELRAG